MKIIEWFKKTFQPCPVDVEHFLKEKGYDLALNKNPKKKEKKHYRRTRKRGVERRRIRKRIKYPREVRDFIKERVVYVLNSFTETSLIYEEYLEWCKEKELISKTKTVFFRMFNYFSEKEQIYTGMSNGRYGYRGVWIESSDFGELDDLF